MTSGRAAKFAPNRTPQFQVMKIPPYEAEFIFLDLKKGRPNLHQIVRLSLSVKKIPPYEAEFIFPDLKKGRPNLHRIVRLSLSVTKYPPTKRNLFSVTSGRAAKFAPNHTPQF